ncbi:hypothetical protein [Owenweeksia hongkongensis]|uniref:hypothetical protein n=1 Tax=Owenweeksia hongkongensis TaxID=253245 RepID=UPI003A8E3869
MFTSVILACMAIYMFVNSSRAKKEYESVNGVVKYLDSKYQDLPRRHEGDYRYLKVGEYPLVFEVYLPNSTKLEKSIDDLNVGEEVQVYFYEAFETEEIGVNKFAQFIDSGNEAYFIRGNFYRQLSFVLLGLSVCLFVFMVILGKRNKLNWL